MLNMYIKVGSTTYSLDIDEGQTIHLIKQAADIKDITKKTGELSLNIAIQRTLNNDAIFSQLWHVNTLLNAFDLNTSYETVIQVENVTIEGKLIMNSISYGGGNNIYNAVAYNTQFLSLGASFFNDIQDFDLLDMSDYIDDYSHTFTAANIEGSFNNTYTDGYVYPMLLTNGNTTNLNDWRPSHYVRNLFDMVHRAVGKSWSMVGVDSALFNKLVLINASRGVEQSIDQYTVKATNTDTLTEPTHPIGTNTTWSATLTNFTEQLDTQNLFDPTTGEYTVPYEVLAGSAIAVRFSANIDLRLTHAGTAYLVGGVTSRYVYQVRLRAYNSSNVLIAQHFLGLNSFEFDAGDDFTNSVVLGTVTGNYEMLISNLTAGEVITFKVSVVSQMFGSCMWRDGATVGDALIDVDTEVEFNNAAFEIVPPPYVSVSGDTINMKEWLPKGYKAKDFVKDLCTMFNLIPEVEGNEVTYRTRDEYYNTTDVYELDSLIALDKGFERRFLFQENVKKLTLSYKSSDDYYNEVYTSNTNEIFGQANYFFNNNRRNEEVKSVTLKPLPVAVNDIGVVVPAITPAEKVGARIGIHNGSELVSTYSILSPTVPLYNAGSAPLISHYDELNDLCFGTPDIVFVDQEPPAANLYNRYYRNTFGTLEKSEIINCWAWISPESYRYFNLRAKYLLFGKLWVINKMDYNANGMELAQLELLTIEGIELPFKPPVIVKPVKPSKRPTYNLINLLHNIDNSGGGAVVTGFGNVAQEDYKGLLTGEFINAVEPEKAVVNKVRSVAYDTSVEDDDYCIIFTANNKTVTVPLASENEGRILVGKNASSGTLTFQRSGSDLIEGATSAVLPSGASGTIVSDGVGWYVIGIY